MALPFSKSTINWSPSFMVLRVRKNTLKARSKLSISLSKMKIILSAWSLMKRENPRFEGGELNYRIPFWATCV
jgi:hypothetical protein